jgi:hypothetical protein
MQGFIYIIRHGNDNRFKVGKTSNPNPLERRDQLDSTGVPEKLKLIQSFPVDNIDISEKKVHQALEQYKLRREWFHNISEGELIKIVKDECGTKFKSDSDTGSLNNEEKEIFLALINEDVITFEKICELAESNSSGRPYIHSWSPYIGLGHDPYIFKKLFYIFTFNKKLPVPLLNENLNFSEERNKKFHKDFIAKLAKINLKTFINNTSNLFKKKPSLPFNLLFLGRALYEIKNISEGGKAILFSNWKNQIEIISNNKISLNDRNLDFNESLSDLHNYILKSCRDFRIR